jgi:O-antigen/teichoic acid export membrane protein
MYAHLHTLSRRILPTWIHNRLIGDWDQNGFQKYFQNTGWIFIAKMMTFAMSFLTVAMVARYLGPENYGKLSYAQSFVSIFSVFASLGIDQILYRDLVSHPEREYEILGTAFMAKLIFGSITFIVTIICASIVNTDPILTWMIGIIALTFLLQPLGILSLFFQARVQAKYASIITMILAFLIPGLKLLIITIDQGILYFATLLALEALVLALFNTYLYIAVFHKNPLEWKYSGVIFKKLAYDSWPLLLASFSGYLYGRIDQVMIQHVLNSASVGLFDAAVRLTEIWGFFPGIFITSLFPAIINARKSNHAEYVKRFITLCGFSLSVAAVIAACVCLTAPLIIGVMFGPEFHESATILRIYIWSLVGAIAVSLMQSYLITENKTTKIFFLSSFGALVNITLNWQLIPLFGVYGAAYTTVVSYIAIIVMFSVTENKLFFNLKKNSK